MYRGFKANNEYVFIFKTDLKSAFIKVLIFLAKQSTFTGWCFSRVSGSSYCPLVGQCFCASFYFVCIYSAKRYLLRRLITVCACVCGGTSNPPIR